MTVPNLTVLQSSADEAPSADALSDEDRSTGVTPPSADRRLRGTLRLLLMAEAESEPVVAISAKALFSSPKFFKSMK